MTARRALARAAVARALEEMRAGRPKEAGAELIHAAHDGVWVADLVAEIIDQTGGEL